MKIDKPEPLKHDDYHEAPAEIFDVQVPPTVMTLAGGPDEGKEVLVKQGNSYSLVLSEYEDRRDGKITDAAAIQIYQIHPGIRKMMGYDGIGLQFLLGPADARGLAASLLQLADEMDGQQKH